MAPFGRRRFLQLAAAAAATTAGCDAAPPGRGLVAERHALAVPGLSPAHDGLRVAQLSDLHLGPLTPEALVRDAIACANAFQPDLVVLTGDYLTRLHVVHTTTDPRHITEQLGGLAAPTVATLGNHDWMSDASGAAAALEGLGYAVLRNENTTLALRGEPFTIVGIDDASTHHDDAARAVRGARPGSRLHLAHVPETVHALRRVADAPALLLSGHTHGAQINVPPFSSRFRYRAGLYEIGSVQLYVNRGIGMSWAPMRINAPPEVTLITLHTPGARAPATGGVDL